MGAQIEQFPLFPLGVVALPHELVPLHIFEPRYKVMIARCLDEGVGFGIVWATEEGVRGTGCACAIERVLRELDDGRLDILTVGTHPLALRSEIDDIPYPAVTVELLDDVAEEVDGDALEQARSAYGDLVLAVTDEPPDVVRLEAMGAYAMAATVEIGLGAKQELLELRSETARLRFVAQLFRGQLKRLEYADRAKARAASNGKVRFG